MDLAEPAPINMIDYDDADAVALWKTYSIRSADSIAIAVTARTDLAAEMRDRIVQRPMRIQHLLRELDRIVLTELGFVPSIAEGGIDEVQLRGMAVAEAERSNRAARFKALIVDDSPTVRSLMTLSLSHLSIACDAFESADAASKSAMDSPYDIAFLDVEVPGLLDGYKLCRRIKANPATRETPVIMLTGRTSPIDKVKGKMAGSNSYLTKPLSQGDLERVLKKHLDL
ncbi:hypothetical protein CKO23_11945 [Thiocystis violacea]|nr:hypothetical protein [Thiocystis violacea]